MCLHNFTMFYGRTDGYLLCYEFGENFCGICLSTIFCAKCWYWFGWKFLKNPSLNCFLNLAPPYSVEQVNHSAKLSNMWWFRVHPMQPLDLDDCVFLPKVGFQESKLELVRTQLQVRILCFPSTEVVLPLENPFNRPFARLEVLVSPL